MVWYVAALAATLAHHDMMTIQTSESFHHSSVGMRSTTQTTVNAPHTHSCIFTSATEWAAHRVFLRILGGLRPLRRGRAVVALGRRQLDLLLGGPDCLIWLRHKQHPYRYRRRRYQAC